MLESLEHRSLKESQRHSNSDTRSLKTRPTDRLRLFSPTALNPYLQQAAVAACALASAAAEEEAALAAPFNYLDLPKLTSL